MRVHGAGEHASVVARARFDLAIYGRREQIGLSGMVPLAELRGFMLAVIELIERYVPPQRQEAELANLFALARELADTPEALVPPAALRTRGH